jgi:plastocyanin
MGEPPSSVNTFERQFGSDVNDFFPHGVKIHVGDRIRFVPTGFHTVNFPARGKAPLPLVAPSGNTIAGVNDAAGAPFWFNGQPDLQFNPALVSSSLFGKRVTLNRSKGLVSGLPLSNRPKPFTVRFTKSGKFTYFCNVHPGMKGTVRVLRSSARIPSAAADRKAVKRTVKRDLATAKKLATKKAPTNTVNVGTAGPGGVDFYGMVPGNLAVPVGTTVNFRMDPLSREVHTATFGPGNPETQPTSYLGQIAASFQGAQLDQRGVYPSERPGTPAAYTAALHGNGFWNSGVLDNGASTPLPASNSVTFAQAGTFNYYCLIHPFMHGVITVK